MCAGSIQVLDIYAKGAHVRFKILIGDDETVPFILNSDLVNTFPNMSILDLRPISSIFYDDKLCP